MFDVKRTGQSACFVVPWGGELQIGKHVVKLRLLHGAAMKSRCPTPGYLEHKLSKCDPTIRESVG